MTYPGMTMVAPTAAAKNIVQRVERMKRKAASRDDAINRVLAVREGRFMDVWPGFFPENFPHSMVANFVDIAARDFAANLAPLPALACSAGSMHTEVDKKRAQRRNRIGGTYWEKSKLEQAMEWGADQYITYAFLPFYVEADYERRTPVIHVDDPKGAYYTQDRWGNTTTYAHTWRKDREELAELYPEYSEQLLGRNGGQYRMSEEVEFIRWVDDMNVILFVPECGNLVLAQRPHNMPYCPVSIAERPGVSKNPRGQFDDVLWVQFGSIAMAALTLEAGFKAVSAPIAVPLDMQELPLGPDALLPTDSPDKVRRISLDVPSSVFALSQQLQQEQSTGAGLPDARLGDAPPGGVTGRGVSALLGGWSTQISQGQRMLGAAEKRVTEMCFDMDRIYWPTEDKTIRGTLSGESFQFTYTPSTELDESTKVAVSFGFSAGQSPSATIVTLLQLQAAGLVSKSTIQRNLPFPIDPEQQQREIDEQVITDGMQQGLAAGLQAVSQLIASGQAAVALQFMNAGAAAIEARRQGKDLGQVLVKAFAPPPAPAPEPGAEPGAPAGAGGGPGGTPGVQPNGLPQGVAPGQAGLPPGGQPSVTNLAAGFLSSGAANVSATVRHRIANGSQ